MMLIKVMVLTLCIYMAYGSESSDKLGVSSEESTEKESYAQRKLEVIANMVNVQQKDGKNVTVIGSQNIYGPNGDVIEVRTVELHIPYINKTIEVRGLLGNSKANDDSNPSIYDKLSEAKDAFDLTSKLGFPLEVSAEAYEKTGTLLSRTYVAQDQVYGYDDWLKLANKTIKVNSIKTVDERIKELQEKGLKVAVHKFDINDTFLSKESIIVPEYTVTVLSEDDDPDKDLIESVQEGLARVYVEYQNNPQEVPSKLREYLNLKHPQLDFTVFLNEQESHYVTRTYIINVRYDLTDWVGGENPIYSVFVRKYDQNATSSDNTVAS